MEEETKKSHIKRLTSKGNKYFEHIKLILLRRLVESEDVSDIPNDGEILEKALYCYLETLREREI